MIGGHPLKIKPGTWTLLVHQNNISLCHDDGSVRDDWFYEYLVKDVHNPTINIDQIDIYKLFDNFGIIYCDVRMDKDRQITGAMIHSDQRIQEINNIEEDEEEHHEEDEDEENEVPVDVFTSLKHEPIRFYDDHWNEIRPSLNVTQ